MGKKARLAELDSQIRFWESMSGKYPGEAYAKTLAKVRKERSDIVNKIGNAQCRLNTKKSKKQK